MSKNGCNNSPMVVVLWIHLSAKSAVQGRSTVDSALNTIMRSQIAITDRYWVSWTRQATHFHHTLSKLLLSVSVCRCVRSVI